MKHVINKHTKLRIAYLVGIVDGEGSFSISLKKQETSKWGWYLDPVFSVCLTHKDRIVLEALQETLGCGRIIQKPGQEHLDLFLVDNRRQIMEKVIPFFERYPLVIKNEVFVEFAEIVEALERKEHATKVGFINLVKKTLALKQNKGTRIYALDEVLTTIEKQA